MNVLEPCAFCGGAGHVYEDGRFSSKPYDFPKWYIICEKCGIRTPIAKMEQIVKIWNRRTKDIKSYTKADYIMCLHKQYGCDLIKAEKAHEKALQYLRDNTLVRG